MSVTVSADPDEWLPVPQGPHILTGVLRPPAGPDVSGSLPLMTEVTPATARPGDTVEILVSVGPAVARVDGPVSVGVVLPRGMRPFAVTPPSGVDVHRSLVGGHVVVSVEADRLEPGTSVYLDVSVRAPRRPGSAAVTGFVTMGGERPATVVASATVASR